MSEKYTDQELADGMKAQKPEIYRFIYREFAPGIRSMVIQNSGNAEDAEDLFQESLLSMYVNIRDGKYQIQEKFSSYLQAVARNKWLKKLRQAGRAPTQSIGEWDAPDEYDDSIIERKKEMETRFERMAEQFERMDERCATVLKMFYFAKKRLEEIAEHFQWTPAYAKKAKFNCMNKLREAVLN
jgi:RNA polymerase sigma factor (sigma-70 family)